MGAWGRVAASAEGGWMPSPCCRPAPCAPALFWRVHFLSYTQGWPPFSLLFHQCDNLLWKRTEWAQRTAHFPLCLDSRLVPGRASELLSCPEGRARSTRWHPSSWGNWRCWTEVPFQGLCLLAYCVWASQALPSSLTVHRIRP